MRSTIRNEEIFPNIRSNCSFLAGREVSQRDGTDDFAGGDDFGGASFSDPMAR